MFTDIHLDGKNKTCSVTVENLVNNIQREKPDLVILGGDNVTSAFNKTRSHQLAKIFEKLDVYWAGVLGNHEGDNDFSISRTEMVEIFTKYDHCLMLRGLDEIEGDCNYAINILNSDNSLKETFFFLDTFNEVSDEIREEYNITKEGTVYDGAKKDQIDWYSGKVKSIKKEYGDFKSVMVIHIPLPQYVQALEDGNDILYGENLENQCPTGFENGLFEAIKKSDSTQAVFCGHDHLNSYGVKFEGITLSYIEPSGYSSYTTASKLGYEEKDWLQGYTKLIINSDGTYSHSFTRNSEVTK